MTRRTQDWVGVVKTPGQVAFEGAGGSRAQWDMIGHDIQESWEAAARAVMTHVDDRADGAARIRAERQRQLAKWPASHDDKHKFGTLAVIAAAMAVASTDAAVSDPCGRVGYGTDQWDLLIKHPDTIRRLEIAGALIAAEIDRMVREHVRSFSKDDSAD